MLGTELMRLTKLVETASLDFRLEQRTDLAMEPPRCDSSFTVSLVSLVRHPPPFLPMESGVSRLWWASNQACAYQVLRCAITSLCDS